MLYETDSQYGRKINQLQLEHENEKAENDKITKEKIKDLEDSYLIKLNNSEEKITKLRKKFKTILHDYSNQIDDLTYNNEFLTKQMYKKQEGYEEYEIKSKKNIEELNDLVYDLKQNIAENDENTQEKCDKVKREYIQKINELNIKHEDETKDILLRNDRVYNDLRIFYQEKLKKTKEKYKRRLNELSEKSNRLIESLYSKLNSKIKMVKQQKSEISGFKTQLKYMDSTLKIFSPVRSSITPSKALEGTRKSVFLRPNSVIGYRAKQKLN